MYNTVQKYHGTDLTVNKSLEKQLKDIWIQAHL